MRRRQPVDLLQDGAALLLLLLRFLRRFRRQRLLAVQEQLNDERGAELPSLVWVAERFQKPVACLPYELGKVRVVCVEDEVC